LTPSPSLLASTLLLAALGLGCGDRAANGAPAPESAPKPELRLRVQTARVERAPLAATQRISGTVRAFVEATVKAETQGRVLARPAERGAVVSLGDVLVELDASRLELELRQTQATLRARQTDLEHARREHERGERLVEQDAISEQRRDDLRHGLAAARDAHALARVARDTATRLLEDASIRAPVEGRVDDLFVEVGDFVTAGTPVAHVLDLSRVRVFGGVTAEEAARLEPGARARARFASLGGFSQEALLKSVARAADPGDGTYRIELWIEAPDPRLRDGVVTTLEFEGGASDAQPLAPRAALVRRGGRSEVFVVQRDADDPARGVARLRPVRTGRSGVERVEVLEGLAPGEEVVVEGQFALYDGAPVTVDGTEAPVKADGAAAPAAVGRAEAPVGASAEAAAHSN